MVFKFSSAHHEQEQARVFDGYLVLLLHACVTMRQIHHCFKSVVIMCVDASSKSNYEDGESEDYEDAT